MEGKILVGQDQKIIEVPQATWKQGLAQIPHTAS